MTLSFFCWHFILLACLGGCAGLQTDRPAAAHAPPAVVARLDSQLLDRATRLARYSYHKNQVCLLDIGYDALVARVHLIRSARKSIRIQTMIWVNDETGRFIVYELIQAARRGVQVRLLIDHLASEHDLEIAAFLANVHPNFQVKLFNPLIGLWGNLKAHPSLVDKAWAVLFSFNRLNQRMHNKTFIVDGAAGITGGRNYQNAYYDHAFGMNYKDRDLLVLGPAVGAFEESFDSYWTFERSVNLHDLKDVRSYPAADIGSRWLTRESFQLNNRFTDVVADSQAPDQISARFVDPLLEVEAVEFIADRPSKTEPSAGRDNVLGKVPLELARLVSRAEASVLIQTPYLVLSSSAIELFKTLRKRYPDMDIRISTNSLAATDSWYVYALSYQQKKTYLKSLKFKIFEFKPLPRDIHVYMPGYGQLRARKLERSAKKSTVVTSGGWVSEAGEYSAGPLANRPFKPPYLCLHAKSLVVDTDISFVGSYNLDPRSENINTECGVIVKDKGFAKRLENSIAMDTRAQNSWVIARKKRFVGVAEANAALVDLSRFIPIVDPWPFRYSASFELIPGRSAVDTADPDFYKNYRDVGSFPQVEWDAIGKEVGAIGTKTLLGFVKPLL